MRRKLVANINRASVYVDRYSSAVSNENVELIEAVKRNIPIIKRAELLGELILKTISNQDNYLEIVTCQIVRLIKNNKILKMSKREGNFITLQEVFSQVGKDPLRYFMISTKSETSMDFDLNKVIEKNKDSQSEKYPKVGAIN